MCNLIFYFSQSGRGHLNTKFKKPVLAVVDFKTFALLQISGVQTAPPNILSFVNHESAKIYHQLSYPFRCLDLLAHKQTFMRYKGKKYSSGSITTCLMELLRCYWFVIIVIAVEKWEKKKRRRERERERG